MSTVQPIPSMYPRVMPHLAIDGAAEAVEFYRAVLGATERMRMAMPDGTIAHAEIQVGESVLMLADAKLSSEPDPKVLGGSPVALFVYVPDVDAAYERAIAGGAVSVAEPTDHFYGDRVATVDDPYGHRWNVATHVEDVAPEEMDRRAAAVMSGQS